MALSGPRTGRLLGSLACLLGGVTVALEIMRRGQLDWLLLGPAVAVQVAVLVRLGLLVLLAHEPRTDRRPRLSDEQAARVLGATEIAVIAVDESLPTVRTALVAACDAIGPQRVVLVSADERHRELATAMGVRPVAAEPGWQAGLEAAVAAAAAAFMAITSASTAVVPRTLSGLARYVAPRCAWVQTLAVAPEQRRPLEHVDQLALGPAIDSRQAGAWTGAGSLVMIEPLRAVGVERGPLAASIDLQRQGWHGRTVRGTLALAQGDTSADVADDNAIDTAAARIRVVASRRSPLWTTRLGVWQRLVHLRSLTDDLAGTVYAAAVAVAVVALVVGISPIPLAAPVVIGVAVSMSLAAAARWMLSEGLLRPGRLLQSTADEMATSVLAVARALRAWRSGGARSLVVVAVVALELALVTRALVAIVGDTSGSSLGVDLALLVMGLVVLVPLLGASRLIVRVRSLRASRRAPAPMAALVGPHQAQVTDLGADGIGLVVRGLVDLLSTVNVRLMPPDRAPIDLRGQVVRTRAVEGGTLIGVRLIGGVGRRAMDDYVRLWVDRVSRSSIEWPELRRDDTTRPAVRRRGLGLLRLATVFTLVTVGVASLPPYDTGVAAPARAELRVTTDVAPTVLLGAELSVAHTICNRGGQALDELVASLVLPAGVEFVDRSANHPERRVLRDQPTAGSTTVEWGSIADLPTGACIEMTYRLTERAGGPVRVGDVLAGTLTATAGTRSAVASTAVAEVGATVVPVTVHKQSPATDGRVVRSRSAAATEFSLQVDSTPSGAVDDVVVDDYLPAGIEYLGCVTDEDCQEPDTIEQVRVDPDGSGPLAGGRYTHLRWNLGTLEAEATRALRYAVGVAGGGPLATIASVSAADVSGTAGGPRQWASALASITPVDVTVAVAACNTPDGTASATGDGCVTDVVAGGTTGWTATVRTSEYRSLTAPTLEATIGDGLAYTPGSARVALGEASPVPLEPTVDTHADGTQTLTWNLPGTVAPAGTLGIEFATTTLAAYRGSGAPVLIADRLIVAVDVAATADGAGSESAQEPVAVREAGTASITSRWPVSVESGSDPVLSLVATDGGGVEGVPEPCAVGLRDGLDEAVVGHRPGELACFELRFVAPTGVAGRDASITVELPENTAYQWFVPFSDHTPDSVVQVGEVEPVGGSVTFRVGADPNASPRYTEPGQIVHVLLAVRLAATPVELGDGTATVTARAALTGGAGNTVVVRGQLGVRIATPAPTLAVTAVDVRRDDRSRPTSGLAQGDEVVFRLDLGNAAVQYRDPATGEQPSDARDVDVVVVLPEGLGCAAIGPADIAAALDATFVLRDGATDAAGIAEPALRDVACRSDVLSFTADILPAGYDLQVAFTLRVDAAAAAGQEYPITAGVRRFADRAGSTFTPDDNIDPSLADAATNTAAVGGSTTVAVASGTLSRGVRTPSVAPGGAAGRAAIGATATFTVDLTLPPGTTVHDSTVSSSLPDGLAYVPSSVRVVSSPLEPAGFGPADAPAGWSLDDSADGWKLSMPTGSDGWSNDSTSPVSVRLEFDATVRDMASNVAGVALDDDTVWRWNRTPGADPIEVRATEPAAVTVTEPAVGLTRTVAPAGPFVGGEGVIVRLDATAAETGATAHDVAIVECAPAVLGAITPTVAEGWSAAVGDAGSCDAGGTRIDFTAPELAPGSTATLGYTALVVGGVAAGESFSIEGVLTVTSLTGEAPGERTTTVDTGPSEIALAAPTIVGTTGVSQAARSQTVDHVYTITVPAGTRAFDTTVVATVADGLDIVDFTAPSPSYGPTCSVAGAVGHTIAPVDQVVGWFLGDVTAGQQACVMTVGVRTRIAADAPEGSTLAVATAASWGAVDRDTDRTTATADGLDQTIEASTSLAVVAPAVTIGRTVDDTDREVEGGQSVTHTITIANSGDSAAYRVELNDALPTGLAVTDTFAGTCDGAGTATVQSNELAWVLFAGTVGLEPGASCTVTYRAQLAAATTLTDGQTLVSTATVARYLADPDEATRPAADQVAYTGRSASTTLTAVRPTLRVDLTAGDGSERVATQLGTPTDWRIVVSNVSSGASRVARGIDIVDVLPPNWTFTDVTEVTPTRCAVMPMLTTAEQTQTITWSNLCDLQAGEELTIEYRATAQLGAVATPGLVDGAGNRIVHTNTVTLSAEDAAGATLGSAENTAGATLESVDLAVRTTDPGPADDGTAGSVGFAVGVEGAYFVDVANNGPDVVSGTVTVVDTVPAGYLVTAATGTGWTCATTTVVTCTHPGPVEVGGTLPRITITGVPTGAALNDADGDNDPGTGTAVNRATVSSAQPDRLPTNDTDDESTPVRRLTDMAISAQWSPTTPLVAGAQVTGTITVTTNGPSPGTGPVAVNDDLPSGLRLVRVRGTGWNCAGSRVGSGYSADPDTNGRIACSRVLRELAAGSTLEPIEVIVQVDPAQMSATALTARVSHAGDREPGNDVITVSGAVSTSARLTVRVDSGGAPLAVGQARSAVMVVATNQGPSVERGPVVVDVQLPSGADRGDIDAPGWACTSPRSDDTDPPTADLECTFVGDDGTPDEVGVAEVLPSIVVPLGASAAAVESSEPDAPNLVRVTASIRGTTAPTPQQDDLDVAIRPVADVVAVVAPSDTDPWRAGGRGSYAVVVTNNGPSDEYGPVTVSKPIPVGTTFEDGRGDGWSCQVDRGAGGTADLVTCAHARGAALGSSEALLPAGASLSPLMIDVSVSAGLLPGASAAPVTVSGSSAVIGTTDTTWSTASDQVTVEPVTDLSVTRSGEANRLPVAADVTYEVRVSNAGPNPVAAGVTVTDTLPTGVALRDWAGEGWTCLDGATGPTCTFAEPIGVGDTRAVSLTVAASAEAYRGTDPVEGAVTVSGPNAEARPDDNTLGYTVDVAPLVDLAVTQVQTARLVVGRQAAFLIEVRNLGPNAPSTEVTVTDDLPEGLVYGDVEGDDWECVVEAQRLRCTYRGPIETDTALPVIEVPVSVESDRADGVDNVVGVWSPDRDADATNNVASSTLVVRRPGSVVAEPFTGPFEPTADDADGPDLRVDLRTDDAPALGERGTWHIDLSNNGAVDAYDVVLSDIVPSIARPVSATTGDGGLCAVIGQEVRCSFDTLAPESTNRVAVTVEMVGRPDGRTAPNTAVVSSSRTDRRPDDDTAEATVRTGPAGAAPSIVAADTVVRGDDLPASWRPVWVVLLGIVSLLLVLATIVVVVVAPQYRPRLRGRRRA